MNAFHFFLIFSFIDARTSDIYTKGLVTEVLDICKVIAVLSPAPLFVTIFKSFLFQLLKLLFTFIVDGF
jgi:hypothetical protein